MPDGVYTRKSICQLTGITPGEFRSFVHRGLIHPIGRNAHQWLFYGNDTVEFIKKNLFRVNRRNNELSYTTAEAQSVIQKIRKGRPVENVIFETDLHPLIVREIIHDYQSVSKGGVWVNSEQMKTLAKILRSTLLTNARELVVAAREVAEELVCKNCDISDRCTLCLPCAKKRILASEEQRRERRAAKPEPSEG